MTSTLVTGASGFIGRRLVPALVQAGHDVRAMTRHPDTYVGEGSAVRGDVADQDSIYAAMRGYTVAYYLVHSLDRPDFAHRDAAAAENFGRSARRAGIERIVYLGGLGDDQAELSPHLRSRHEVEGLLAADGVPVTTLRAGIVIGHGGSSWEIIRNMVEKVPAIAVPRWALTRSQPIAVADVIRYLVGVLAIDDGDSHVFEIGGAEILRYIDILTRVSAIEGRPALVVPVPLPAKSLATFVASHALPFITGVDSRTTRTLLGSMRNEVVVRDDSIRSVVPFEPMSYDEAVLAALAERAAQKRKA
ncbi:MAG: NAD(P)H-binding protein [Jatrophihabitans sp.]